MKKYPVTEMHWVVTRLLIDLMKLGMEEDCSQNKGYRRTTDNMAIEKKKKVWVVGHKNPDTDSICAAIAYANLKNQSDEGRYEAKRAGELNEETKYVLKTFGVKSPGLITDVGAQVKDIEIRKTPGVSGKISLKRAWEMMKEQNVVTLPVTDGENNLEGLIITGDKTIEQVGEEAFAKLLRVLSGEMTKNEAIQYFSAIDIHCLGPVI